MIKGLLLLLLLTGAAPFSERGDVPWGADADLVSQTPTHKEATFQPTRSARVCLRCIRFFQDVISPIDGPRSHFYPTSSQYAYDAIRKYGMFTGIGLGCDRLMRENHETWVYRSIDGYGPTRKHDPVR